MYLSNFFCINPIDYKIFLIEYYFLFLYSQANFHSLQSDNYWNIYKLWLLSMIHLQLFWILHLNLLSIIKICLISIESRNYHHLQFSLTNQKLLLLIFVCLIPILLLSLYTSTKVIQIEGSNWRIKPNRKEKLNK